MFKYTFFCEGKDHNGIFYRAETAIKAHNYIEALNIIKSEPFKSPLDNLVAFRVDRLY